jgi:hypothetical protein
MHVPSSTCLNHSIELNAQPLHMRPMQLNYDLATVPSIIQTQYRTFVFAS